jgi:hypothetical protein
MKQKTIKASWLFALLLTVSSLFLWNCRPEIVEAPDIHQVSEYPFTKSLLSKHYLQFHEPEVYRQLNSLLGTEVKNFHKQEYVSNEYGFVYNLEQVQRIETENYTQYAIPIIGSGTDETHFENYVLMEYANGEELQLLFTFEKTNTENGFEINHGQTQVQVLDGTSLFANRCLNGMQLVDTEVTTGCYGVACTGTNGHMPGEFCPCGSEYNCIPPSIQCDTATIQTWVRCGGSNDGDGNSSGNTNPSGGVGTTGGNNDPINILPIAEDLRLRIFEDSLTLEEKAWWDNTDNRSLVTYIKLFLLEENYVNEAIIWAKGQIELELLAKNVNWVPEVGYKAGMKYVYKDSNNSQSANQLFKMEDGSVIFFTTIEKKLTQSGDLKDKWADNTNSDYYKFYYIKIPGQEWAEVLYHPDNTFDSLKNLFRLGAVELGKSIGRYVLPIEDLKILIDGRDFDGNEVSRWQAAGFLLLAVIPGGKAVRIIDNAIDAAKIAIKLRGGSMVIDTVQSGLRIVTNNNIVRFLDDAGNEIARLVDGVLTYVYNGFGGNIVSTADKTTTIIGKYLGGTKDIIESGLSKSGRNKGGFNVLDEAVDSNWTDQQIWDNINEPWLREAAENDDVIRAISDPTDPSNIFKPNGELSFFGREHELLTKPISQGGLGYTFDLNTFSYIR